MKVLIVAFGHSDNVVCLTKALSNYIDVTVLFVTSGSRYTASLFDWYLERLPFGHVTDVSTLNGFIHDSVRTFLGPHSRILVARTHSRKLLRDWTRRNYICVKKIAKYVREQNFNVIHFNGSSGFQVYFQIFLSNLPKVLTIHDYLPHTGESSYRRTIISRILNGFYARHSYEFIQHYDYLTEQFSRIYDVGPDRVHTVRCGPLNVYKTFTSSRVSEERHTVLFFGRISEYKGVDYLIQAAPIIEERIPDAKIIIAGSGDLQLEPTSANVFEIHNYHIPNDELVHMIQRASIIVAPYTDATHSAVIMTAFAFNKPVVASAVGGIPEVVEDGITGKLVPPRDSESLADAIVDLLLDSKKRKTIKRNIAARCSIGKLSWDDIAQETMGVYIKAIESFRK